MSHHKRMPSENALIAVENTTCALHLSSACLTVEIIAKAPWGVVAHILAIFKTTRFDFFQ
jgi:hypothetical protein